MAEQLNIPKTPLGFVWFTSKPYAFYMWLCNGSVVLAAGIDAVEPFVYKYIVDSLIGAEAAGTFASVWLWFGIYIALYFSSILAWHIVSYLGAMWYGGVRATGREVLTEYLLRHSHNYFEDRFAGSTANKISHASNGARSLVESWFFGLFGFIITMIVSIGIAFYASSTIGLLFTIWLVVVIPLNYVLSRKRVLYTEQVQALETRLRGISVDVVSNIRAVQEYAHETTEVRGLLPLIAERRIAGMKNWMAGRYIILINGVIQIMFMSGIIATVVWLASEGRVSIGTVVLVLSLTTSVGMKIFHVGWMMSSIAESWGEVKEGLDDILVHHDMDRNAENVAHDLRGSITFDRVGFGYGNEKLLEDFSFTIKEGERVGVVGRSGAGKSTLVKLLLRHYDVSGGSVAIGDANISTVSLESLRHAIAVIPQESSLFHRSLRENIAYGKPDATTEEVERAATLAESHEFISALPMGYSTLVGERGVKLSGGQRQRVAIARAILKDAPILILDEATSALDSESEVAIQRALHELMTGKTVIAIAHRLSTLREMDRIIVLDKGKIAEEGSHDVLVAKGGIYARLWDHQAGGFLQE